MTDWKGAFAGRLEAGERPALLLVDPVRAYVESGSPLFLETGAAAFEQMAELVSLFRARGLPIAWTGVRYRPDGSDGGHFFRKVPALEVFAGDNPLGQFPEAIEPADDEGVFIKQFPSAFFETGLSQWLHGRNVDTLFVCGFSTSGCVRASALDALQHGFIPFAVSDASADRNDDVHSQNLRDLGAKYAEVVEMRDVAELIDKAG